MKKFYDSVTITIARKEFIELVREGRFRWLVGTVCVVFIGGLLAGWHSYAGTRKERERAAAGERERWLTKGPMSGHSAAHFGMWAFRSESPLSAIDQGVTPYTGEAVFLEAHARNPLQYRPATDSTATRRYGELTAAAVLQMFVPLLIIILCYPVFVAEREQGTLRQLMTVGIPARRLGAGKLLGVVTPLFLVLIPLTLIGVVALMLFSELRSLSDSWLRILIMTVGYLVYFVIIAGVALSVSALSASSRQAMILLLAFWFMNCLMVPQVAANVAARIYPGIDGFELPATIANARAKLPSREHLLPDIEKRLLAEYKVTRVEDLPVDPNRVANIELDAAGDRIQEEVFNGLHDAYERQDHVYQAGSVLSPAIAMQSLSMTLCETHFAHYRRFADAAETYRQELVHKMDQADLHDENAKPGSSGVIKHGRETWEILPPFQYSSPGLGWSLSKSFIGVAGLLVWLIVVLIVTPISILKLKVE